MVAPLPGHLGCGLALFVADFEVAEGPRELASIGHFVVASGVDEWGIPTFVSDVGVALIFDEQHHDLREAIHGRRVQRSPPIPILPIDWCPLRNESLGFCRLHIFTGLIKYLVGVQSAFQSLVSTCARAAGAVSNLCFGTRSRKAAHAGGIAYLSKLITFRMALA